MSNPGNIQVSSIPVNIAPGGTKMITAAPIRASDPTRAGWAKLASNGGSPGGVATFQFMPEETLTAIAGVLSAGVVTAASIPVDDDRLQDRITGYAIVNSGRENVNIRIALVNSNGTQIQEVRPLSLNPLPPGGHYSRYLYEDLNNPSLQFKGSIVFMSEGGHQFSIVSLVMDRGLLTAVPVISGKAPNVGN